MKKALVIHPVLFAIYPILFLYAYNSETDTVSASDMFLPILLATGFALFLMGVLSLVLKSREKAGLIVSLILLLFFSYGHLFNAIAGYSIGEIDIGRHRYLLPLYGLLFLSGFSIIIRTRRSLYNLSRIVNVTAASLVAISLINIGVYRVSESLALGEHQNTENGAASTVALATSATLPDIYYIILDEYASAKNLKEFLDFDNDDFIAYLRDKGFYVASGSRSNYVQTALSVASSLNMQYINYLSDVVGVRSKDRHALNAMVENNGVMRFLTDRGYTFVHFGAGWAVTERNRYADVGVECGGLNEFQTLLASTTMLPALADNFTDLVEGIHRERVLCTFSKLAEVQHSVEGPRFVFAHILAPHPPFAFGSSDSGSDSTESEVTEGDMGQEQPYLDNVVFVNEKAKALVDRILSESRTPPIIILQGDHGTASTGGWSQPGERLFRERTGILNAYYLPGNGKAFLYDSITPVNTFRLIFDRYFNGGYSLLEDRMYFSSYERPYDFIDITDVLVRGQ